jgi:phosphatidylinositol alpha-1,6-mannosyltransferase
LKVGFRDSRITFAITGAYATAGGIAVVNRQILHVLARISEERSTDITVLSFLELDRDRPPFLPRAVKFRGFGGSKLRFSFALWRHALSRPVWIFDHVTLAKPILLLAIAGYLRPIIFAHGSESWKRLRQTSRVLFSKATVVLTNSKFTLRKMRERIGQFNGVACPLGLAPEILLNATPPASSQESLTLLNANGVKKKLSDRVCLLVGRMHPREREKGHDGLLAVWPEIVRDFPDVQLVFAGHGEDRHRLEERARALGVGQSVFVPGEVTPETLQKLYAHCYAFTMPSRQEGFGLVYLEAMNFAKPCLGCRDDGAEEVIADQETGLLINDPKDKEELRSALRRLLSDPAAAREMGKLGFERLHKHFTAAHVQERIREQLLKVI